MGRIRTDLVQKALPFIDGASGEISLGSSRMKCYNGKLYSYASHYPLLFPVCGFLFVNDHGYSATTRMHIAAARQYAQYAVSLNGSDTSAENVRESLQSEKDYLERSRAALKRKGTKKESALVERMEKIQSALDALANA